MNKFFTVFLLNDVLKNDAISPSVKRMQQFYQLFDYEMEGKPVAQK
jgi:hypothetical protein